MQQTNSPVRYPAVCSVCGVNIVLPFIPVRGSKVYCQTHLYLKKGGSQEQAKESFAPRPKKEKTPSLSAPCYVFFVPLNRSPMFYNEDRRTLTVRPDKSTEFPSVQKARAAVYRTLEAGFYNGVEYVNVKPSDFDIRTVSELNAVAELNASMRLNRRP